MAAFFLILFFLPFVDYRTVLVRALAACENCRVRIFGGMLGEHKVFSRYFSQPRKANLLLRPTQFIIRNYFNV
jgi:hypothetical protein